MANDIDEAIEGLNTPGVVVEVDPRTAADLGAFKEDALSEAEALEAAFGYEEGEGRA